MKFKHIKNDKDNSLVLWYFCWLRGIVIMPTNWAHFENPHYPEKTFDQNVLLYFISHLSCSHFYYLVEIL